MLLGCIDFYLRLRTYLHIDKPQCFLKHKHRRSRRMPCQRARTTQSYGRLFHIEWSCSSMPPIEFRLTFHTLARYSSSLNGTRPEWHSAIGVVDWAGRKPEVWSIAWAAGQECGTTDCKNGSSQWDHSHLCDNPAHGRGRAVSDIRPVIVV